MKNFWDFVDFIVMMELKQPDSIVRNYTIECKYNREIIRPNLSDDFVRLGMARLGFTPINGSGMQEFKEILAALRGIKCYVHEIFIMAYLAQFYNYHRIKTGELKTWPKRKPLATQDS